MAATDLTRDLAGVYTTVMRDVKYGRDWVLVLLTEAAPDDPAGGLVRLATVRTGFKLSAPKVPAGGERREYMTVACLPRPSAATPAARRQYEQPAGQAADDLINLVARTTQYELRNERTGEFVRYGRAEGNPRPRTATRVWRQAVVMSETDRVPWHDPAP